MICLISNCQIEFKIVIQKYLDNHAYDSNVTLRDETSFYFPARKRLTWVRITSECTHTRRRSPLQSRRAPPFLYIVIERSNHQDERAASQAGRQLRDPSWGQPARIYHVRASHDDVSNSVRAIVASFQRSASSSARGSVIGTCLDYRGA